MKLKYYLRGLGIGIIVTTIILSISFGGKKADIEDIPEEEIIAKATTLGMVMKDESDKLSDSAKDAETEGTAPLEPSGQASDTEETAGEPEEETEEDTSSSTEQQTEEQQTEEQTEEQTPEEQPSYQLVVKPGNLCSTVGRNLERNGVIDDADAWCAFMTEQGYASLIKAGSYEIPYDLTYEEIADIIKKGPVKAYR